MQYKSQSLDEEDFLELFKYTGPEVIPGEFYRAVNKIIKSVSNKSYTFGFDFGWHTGFDRAVKVYREGK